MRAVAKGALLVVGFSALFGTAVRLLPDPVATDFASILASPSGAHPLGTDHLGRDMAARLLVGGRLTVGLSVLTVMVTGVVGVATGMLAGALGGRCGRALLRYTDLLAALPAVLFALIAAVVLGPGVKSLLLATWAVGWTPFARQAYQLTVRECARDYVEAVVALGSSRTRVLAVHVARNIARPLLAHACVRFAGTLLTVSGLSFLGLGMQPPTPEWGAMVAEGRDYLFTAPHVVLAPSLAVVLVSALATFVGRRLGDSAAGKPHLARSPRLRVASGTTARAPQRRPASGSRSGSQLAGCFEASISDLQLRWGGHSRSSRPVRLPGLELQRASSQKHQKARTTHTS